MREKLLGIIKSLDTNTLHQMLQSAGIHVGGGKLGESEPGMAGDDNASGSRIQKWKDVKIPMSEEKRPPIVSTKDFIVKKQEGQHGKPGYLCDNEGDGMQELSVYGGE